MLPDKGLHLPDEELTTAQCAKAIGMNRRTIIAWIHAGHLPAERLPGRRGQYRVLWKDLYAVLRTPVTPPGQGVSS